MKIRMAVLAALVAASAVACGPQPPRSSAPGNPVTPEYCPYDDQVVQFNGDSIGVHTASRLQLPEYSVFNAAQGGAGWVFDDVVSTIPSRVASGSTSAALPVSSSSREGSTT